MSRETHRKLTAYFEEIRKTSEVNSHDIERCIDAIGAEKDKTLRSFWLRSLVRSFFASVESSTFQMKYLALYLCEHYEIDISPMEISIIKEESFDVKENGEVNLKKLKIPTISHLKFSCKILSKSIGQDFDINKFKGWNNFVGALEIRDKITHPKSADSLQISRRQFEVIIVGLMWYNETTNEILKEVIAFIKDKNSKNLAAQSR